MRSASKQVTGNPGRNGGPWRHGMPTEQFASPQGHLACTSDASTESLAEMAERGDFAGVLSSIRQRSVFEIPPGTLDVLTNAIHHGQGNLDALVERAFGEAIGFGSAKGALRGSGLLI